MTVFVRVEWEDIVQKSCMELERIHPAKCVSYGELESQDENEAVVITERMDEAITRQAFPVGCVKRIVKLYETPSTVVDLGNAQWTSTWKPTYMPDGGSLSR